MLKYECIRTCYPGHTVREGETVTDAQLRRFNGGRDPDESFIRANFVLVESSKGALNEPLSAQAHPGGFYRDPNRDGRISKQELFQSLIAWGLHPTENMKLKDLKQMRDDFLDNKSKTPLTPIAGGPLD